MEDIKEHEIIESGKHLSSNAYSVIENVVGADKYNDTPDDIKTLQCLGVKKENGLYAGYYIGIDWIPDLKETISIIPKIDNLDYFGMFISVLNCKDRKITEAISKIYYINFDDEYIQLQSNKFEITPFLIYHFVTATINAFKRGLKYNYAFEEDNLKSKIKGKILINQQIKYNYSRNRTDKNYCRYQTYSQDCIENKLLKKALVFSKRYLNNIKLKSSSAFEQMIDQCLSKLQNVSDSIDIRAVKQLRINPLYKHYSDSLRLAKYVLKRFGYDFTNTNDKIDTNVPPFWINMPLLFEVYVYSKLLEQDPNIEYQANGRYGQIDFLSKDKQLLIDTKYKPTYSNYKDEENCDDNDDTIVKGRYNIEDIRQLSGYSRDKALLKKLGINESDYDKTVPKCVVVYPLDHTVANQQTKFDITNLCNANEIKAFTNFYRVGILLPLK
jgi:5-methylcytosine-specific restriction enzyme subunit McrC